MLPSPSSSPVQPHRDILTNRTNQNSSTQTTETPTKPLSPWSYLPTPTQDVGTKRSSTDDGSPRKRVKIDSSSKEEGFDTDASELNARVEVRARRNCWLKTLGGPRPGCAGLLPSTPVLRSFVSSNKSDLFKWDALDDGFINPPYACSYSHSAKTGGRPYLALATEHGSVHILDTRKRLNWDVEPQRTTFQPHRNGVYDVKWNRCDQLLATCSADRSGRILDVSTGNLIATLQGHAGSVKCIAWDSYNDMILSTGGRDGDIHVWDLRLPQREALGVAPVATISGAHDGLDPKSRKKKTGSQNSVTNLVQAENMALLSSGSADGLLRCWDLRFMTNPKKNKAAKNRRTLYLHSSPIDPTTLHNSRRARGILGLATGTGPTSGLVFALGADSRIHTYAFSTLEALPISYTHPSLRTSSSFYLGISISPCGRSLASGSSGMQGSAFLFDISNAARPGSRAEPGIELSAQVGEIGPVDWADGMLATCADESTVRIWRPDIEVYRACLEDPIERKWDWSWAS
ncbi:WD40 repeat-like protein [Marasmius fiardii PR-910]|nr:WD40 repeat-like protein [Marasmius fiardii PR-910]